MTNVLKVDKNRWELAQQWERHCWNEVQKARDRYGKNLLWRLMGPVRKSKYRGDDWNYWWKERFQNYDFLPRSVENGIELGCGPYTNLRLIVDLCSINHLFLSDPLISEYVRYKSTFVGEMHKQSFCILDDHPIEESPFAANYFDLVVMINVLDHVQDAELCMRNAIRMVKPNGILLFGQDLTDETDMSQEGVRTDVGHPVRMDHEWIDGVLKRPFEAVLCRILPRELGRNPEAHYGTYIFAGKKLQAV